MGRARHLDGRDPGRQTLLSLTGCPESKAQPLHASTSEAVTNNVRVEVESQYAPEHSHPFQHEWFFHYTVRIRNEGETKVQLLSRHWIITDATDSTEEVKGPGVVGEKPVLGPGESVSVHLAVPAEDAARRDARHLSDGDRRRRLLRRRDRAVRASRAATPSTRFFCFGGGGVGGGGGGDRRRTFTQGVRSRKFRRLNFLHCVTCA